MSETEYISRDDFRGKNSAIVEDVFGTRMAFRNIPRGNEILFGAVLSINPTNGTIAANISQVVGEWPRELAPAVMMAWVEAIAEGAVRAGFDPTGLRVCPEGHLH